MSRHGDPDRLEAYYRQLLAVYPPGHRARYGEEMIGVLMATSAPGQRRPNLREALDLVLSGLRTRLGAGLGGDLSPAGRSAARVFGFLSSVVVAVLFWYEVAVGIAWRGLLGSPVTHSWLADVPQRSLVLAVGWTLVACACAAGQRRVAALGAVLGFFGYAVIVGREYDSAPGSLVSSWWLLTLTAFTAACLVTLIRLAPALDEAWPADGGAITEVQEPSADARDRRTPSASGWRGMLRRDADWVRPLGRRAVAALTAGALLTVIEPFVGRALTVVEPVGNGGWRVSSSMPVLPGLPGRYDDSQLGAIVLVVTLAVLVLRLRPAVRRRVLLLSAPIAGTLLLVQTGFQGFTDSSPRFWPPVYLTIGQWAALVLVPLLIFATGTWLLHRYERKLASGALLT